MIEGLEVPWDMRFLPDGDLLVTERRGRILRADPGTGQTSTIATLPVAAQGESGLLGLALDPSYPAEPFIYITYTHLRNGGLVNRVSRLRYDPAGTQATGETVLLDGIPGGAIHDGSRLTFGPDGALYVTTGDSGRGELAPDLGSPAGKVLRMDRDGRPLPDNPFPGSLVFTYGHRNPQGLDTHPDTGVLFVTEHGPNENDELNRLQAGGEYGWPSVTGRAGIPGLVDPIAAWTPTIAPAGATFYNADLIPGWRGSFLFVTLKEQDLRRLTPADAEFTTVHSEEILFDGAYGRLRAIRVGPDGSLYISTSNRDGRGSLPGSDRILRISPRTAAGD